MGGGGTGKNSKTCKFFEKLDAILGHRPACGRGIYLLRGAWKLKHNCTSEFSKSHLRNTSGDLIVRTQESIMYIYKDNEKGVERMYGVQSKDKFVSLMNFL